MKREAVNIVWLKRDIRSQDHEPLLKAEQLDIPYHIIYLFEPSLIKYPDTSSRHLKFIYHSIIALNKTLAPFNRNVTMFYGEATDVFEYLTKIFEIKSLFSFRESGHLLLIRLFYIALYRLDISIDLSVCLYSLCFYSFCKSDETFKPVYIDADYKLRTCIWNFTSIYGIRR